MNGYNKSIKNITKINSFKMSFYKYKIQTLVFFDLLLQANSWIQKYIQLKI